MSITVQQMRDHFLRTGQILPDQQNLPDSDALFLDQHVEDPEEDAELNDLVPGSSSEETPHRVNEADVNEERVPPQRPVSNRAEDGSGPSPLQRSGPSPLQRAEGGAFRPLAQTRRKETTPIRRSPLSGQHKSSDKTGPSKTPEPVISKTEKLKKCTLSQDESDDLVPMLDDDVRKEISAYLQFLKDTNFTLNKIKIFTTVLLFSELFGVCILKDLKAAGDKKGEAFLYSPRVQLEMIKKARANGFLPTMNQESPSPTEIVDTRILV